MRLFMLVFVAASGVLLFTGCDESRGPIHLSGATMGTQYHVTIARAPADFEVDVMRREIDAELHRINAQMSTYLPDSEISRFNSQSETLWFDVSPEFASVVKRAQEVSEMTGGAFDVTVGPFVDRWNFGPDKTNLAMPSDAEVAALKQAVGFRLIEIRDQPPALRKQRPEVQIDLSAIAKGFAVDRITQLLESHGLQHYLAEIGGEVRARGTNAAATAWTVGIEKPVADARLVHRVVHLRDAAMATSGDYRNFIEIDSRRYSHMIDPRTGYPVDHHLASVSVIADDCVSADAWATALMVLGPEHGYELAQRLGIAALMMERTETDFLERATPEFENIVTAAQATKTNTFDSQAITVFLCTLAAFALAVAAMAVGVMISNRRLRGSCGGLAGLKDASGRPLCDACSHPSEDCRLSPLEGNELLRSESRHSMGN
ncbi:MAG: FAD:protein FMN transferase [Planctomycetaceae bacterium]|nr:FAD:protein FMN transferase [Planctomycetaceae bacterium]MCA9222608.1 FAD:protein FMN transferase [Planctomycetales bacterium]